MLVGVWGLAISGLVLKVIFFEDVPEFLGLTFFLGLGWLGLGSVIVIARRNGFSYIKPLVASGLAYTLGGIADFLSWPTLIEGVLGPHELMHAMVLAGIGGFWWFFYTRLPQAYGNR